MRPQANRAAPPPFAGKSEAHENFVSKTPDPPRSFKPKVCFVCLFVLISCSMFLTPPPPLHWQNAYTPSQAKFSSETTASSAYTGEPTTRASPMKPRSTRPAELPPFAGTTTLKADYPAHEVSKRAPIKPESRPMESKPFSGTTTANASYQPFTNVAPARSVCPSADVCMAPYLPLFLLTATLLPAAARSQMQMKPVNARSTPPKFEGQPVSKSGKSSHSLPTILPNPHPSKF